MGLDNSGDDMAGDFLSYPFVWHILCVFQLCAGPEIVHGVLCGIGKFQGVFQKPQLDPYTEEHFDHQWVEPEHRFRGADYPGVFI